MDCCGHIQHNRCTFHTHPFTFILQDLNVLCWGRSVAYHGSIYTSHFSHQYNTMLEEDKSNKTYFGHVILLSHNHSLLRLGLSDVKRCFFLHKTPLDGSNRPHCGNYLKQKCHNFSKIIKTHQNNNINHIYKVCQNRTLHFIHNIRFKKEFKYNRLL